MFSHHKMDMELIPAPLQNLPNVTYVEEPPADIRPGTYVQTGCRIFIPESISLRLDFNFLFGTLGFVGTMGKPWSSKTCPCHMWPSAR